MVPSCFAAAREPFTPPLTERSLLKSHGARGNPSARPDANEEQRIDARGRQSTHEITTKRSISLRA